MVDDHKCNNNVSTGISAVFCFTYYFNVLNPPCVSQKLAVIHPNLLVIWSVALHIEILAKHGKLRQSHYSNTIIIAVIVFQVHIVTTSVVVILLKIVCIYRGDRGWGI